MSVRTKSMLATVALLSFSVSIFAQAPKAGPTPGAPRPGGPGGPGAQGAAQGGRRGGGGRGISAASLPIPVIELITPLTADQKTKITKIHDKLTADLKTATRETRRDIMTKATTDVKAVLTPAQSAAIDKELPTIGIVAQTQAIPLGTMKDVKLTKAQFTRIDGIVAPTITQLKGVEGRDRFTKLQELAPKLKPQIEAVLTPVQKAAIAKWVAANPRPAFGGGGMKGAPGGRPLTPPRPGAAGGKNI